MNSYRKSVAAPNPTLAQGAATVEAPPRPVGRVRDRLRAIGALGVVIGAIAPAGAADTRLVSVNSAGRQGNDGSFSVTLPPDGRFAVFYSFASNLVRHDTSDNGDGSVRDLGRGVTTRVTLGVNGNQDTAAC